MPPFHLPLHRAENTENAAAVNQIAAAFVWFLEITFSKPTWNPQIAAR